MPATTTHPGWTYREVFARDNYETFTGLLADGDAASARAIVRFLFDRTQQPDGSFPRNSLINGAVAPDTSGPGWHRYGIKASGSTDGYGDCYVPDPTSCSPSGAPWFPTAKGSGHPWPLLDGERAEQDLQTGAAGPAISLLQAMQNMTSGLGLVPEQAWEDPAVAASPYGSDPAAASIGFVDGKPAGSASPLIWAQAQYLRLVTDLKSGSLLDQPAITTDRYVRSKPPAALRMAITSPTPAAGGTGAQTVVTGTAPPGATVVISVGHPTSPANSTSVVSTAANATGRFQATVQTAPGTIVVTATAALGAHATGWTQVTVKP